MEVFFLRGYFSPRITVGQGGTGVCVQGDTRGCKPQPCVGWRGGGCGSLRTPTVLLFLWPVLKARTGTCRLPVLIEIFSRWGPTRVSNGEGVLCGVCDCACVCLAVCVSVISLHRREVVWCVWVCVCVAVCVSVSVYPEGRGVPTLGLSSKANKFISAKQGKFVWWVWVSVCKGCVVSLSECV
jgi:hypothetical protein